MEPDLSEFSCGFALTSELIAKFNLKRLGAPEFATQKAEAKAGGGWDVKLPGIPVYLQFKRSDKMTRKTAREAHLYPSLPFFRMHLRRRDISDQHQLMLDIEAEGKHIFYAAPGFADAKTLSECFISDTVSNSSIFVRPSMIGPLADDERHHVAFRLGGRAYFCSEPREIETVSIDAIRLAEIASKSISVDSAKSNSYSEEAEDLLRIYEYRALAPLRRQDASQIRQLRDRRSPAEFLAHVAHTLFEVEVLLFHKKE